MTFLQSILGKNYKWLMAIIISFKSSTGGLLANSLKMIGDIILGLAITYAWFFNNNSIEVVVYLLMGRFYKNLSEFVFFNRLSDIIITGKITNKLIIPQNILSQYLMEGIGLRIPRNLLEAFGSLIAVLIFCLFASINLGSLFYFDKLHVLLLIPITFCINFLIGFFIGSTGFFIGDKRDISMLNSTYLSVLSVMQGMVIPLDKIPFSSFFTLLPTAWVLHHPMQIYLGKYSTMETIYTFLGGIAWCFIIWILARTIFKFGLKKNEAVGL